MKVSQLSDDLKCLVPPDKLPGVDRIIHGDPDLEITGIVVAWMPYIPVIEKARSLGANVVVTHEPTFYAHLDLKPEVGQHGEAFTAKQNYLDNAAMAVIRCHDAWDAMPDVGIPFAWGDFLQLGKPLKTQRYFNMYSVAPQSAEDFARYVAGKTASLGQQAVGIYGDRDREIKTVVVGTGCISRPHVAREMGADLAISVDDTLRSWVCGAWCHDTGFPCVVVNHCVSEEPGMATLASFLQKGYPDIKVTHVAQTCTYREVKSK